MAARMKRPITFRGDNGKPLNLSSVDVLAALDTSDAKAGEASQNGEI